MSADQTLMDKAESLSFANPKRKLLLVALVHRANLAANKQLDESNGSDVEYEVPITELEKVAQSNTQATAEYMRQLESDGFINGGVISNGNNWIYKIDLTPLCEMRVSL